MENKTEKHEPDLDKLRRFALIVALIILTYSVAGISLDPNSGISLVGLVFKVSKPELLPTSLIIVSLYSMVSFYYYGFMLKKSPFRIRRDIIDGLFASEPKPTPGQKVPIYFGPTEFETYFSYSDHEKVESYVANFPEAFPKFARAKASVRVVSREYFKEDGESCMSYAAKILIPKRCRAAAIFQDIDFASPIWFNVLALAVFFYTR
jgi:hypothetical protein